jgi:hypothetical protein
VAERVKAVERAARLELKALPKALRSSTLAAAAVELARRLDDGPTDREAAAVARELRLALIELHRRAGGDIAPSETDRFIATISAPSFGDASH